MSKNDTQKLQITNFFSEKQLRKVDKLIDKKLSVHETCDELEELFEGTDFKPMDAGTNRYVWRHKKLKGYVFKIACDSHGIEANYKEFYISDLDNRLTKTYSISESGSIIVQEEVERFLNKEKFDRYKKDVVKMLWKLHKKILLVDCQLKNFKNFGLRNTKDGKQPVILDYGDTVPFEDYQDFQTQVNFSEEINVSLRCRRVTRDSGKNTQCKGTLQPSDDFAALICDKCGKSHSFHEAYREFILDKKKKKTVDMDVNEDMLRQIEKEMEDNSKDYYKKYANMKMEGAVEMKNTNKKEMKPEYVIVGEYVIPQVPKTSKFGGLKYNQVLRGSCTPENYLEFIGENPQEWKQELFGDNKSVEEIYEESMVNGSDDNDEEEMSNEERKEYFDKMNIKDSEDEDNVDSKIESFESKGSSLYDEDTEDNDEPSALDEVECDNDCDNCPYNCTNDKCHGYEMCDGCKKCKTCMLFTMTSIEEEKRGHYIADDSELLEFVEMFGNKLENPGINILHMINENIESDRECVDNPVDLKIYKFLVENANYSHIHETITSSMSTFTGLAKIIQNDVWGVIYKSYKLGYINRSFIRSEFKTAYLKMLSTLKSHIRHNDFTIDDFITTCNILSTKFSDTELSYVFDKEVINISEINDEPVEAKSEGNELSNEYDILEILQEIIQVYGEEKIANTIKSAPELSGLKDLLVETVYAGSNVKKQVKDFTSMCNDNGLLLTRLDNLKDKSILISLDNSNTTIVKVNLYEHVIRNMKYIPQGKTSLMKAAAIDLWSDEIENYDKYYNQK